MKKKNLIQVVMLGFAILLFANPKAYSKEHFVSKKLINSEINTNLTTVQPFIQQAIDAAFDGDTIRVAEGVYDQDLININKSIVLLGCQVGNSPKSALNREGGECVILNSLNPFNSIVINAPNVVIDGFKFGVSDLHAFNSIYINAPHVILRNCVIVNTSSCGIYISANAKNSEIAYNHIKKSSFEGIFNTADSVLILSNYISNIQEFSAISTTQKATIKGNIISNIPGNGVNLLEPAAILSLVFGNEITNTGKENVYYCIKTPKEENKLSSNYSVNNDIGSKFNKLLKLKTKQSIVILNSDKNPKSLFGATNLKGHCTVSSFAFNASFDQKPLSSFSIFKF